MTVSAFWETLQLRDEFRQEPSAFFIICFDKTLSTDMSDKEGDATGRPSILAEMQALDWSSREAAIDACSKVIKSFTAEFTIQLKFEDEKENVAGKGNVIHSTVNNIQSLVRKRRRLEY